jgi:exopolysaccharide biosynthesis polyprenyl glycosylphosphotransferase
MLRRNRLIRMQLHELLDACLFALSFWLAYQLRSNSDIIDLFGLQPATGPFDPYVWLYLVLIPAAPMILEAQGFYNRPILGSRATTAWLLLKGCVLISLGLVLAIFLFRIEFMRSVIIWFGVISFALVFLKEEALVLIYRSKVAQAQYQRRFILLGAVAETRRIRAELEARARGEISILAELDLGQTPVQRLVELLHEHSVNGVIVSANRVFLDQVETAIRVCELEGVEVWLVADFFKTQISRTTLDDFHGRPILVFSSAPEASWPQVVKQLVDFVGALLLLLLSLPLLVVVAIIVKVTSPGPVFFRQPRSGLNGRPFVLYKFRTMVTNAEQLKHELAAMNEMDGPVFKVSKDPRVTPIGKFLRKYSLDEFPQLLNVLRGEMSLVGPRPLPVDEVKRFNDLAHRRRLSVRPGLTCLWQVSGRNNVKNFRDWVRLDLEYIDNWSLWLDFKILLQTVPVVLLGTGAK